MYVCYEAYGVVFVDGTDCCERFDETGGIICCLVLFDSTVSAGMGLEVQIGVCVFEGFKCFEVSASFSRTPC